jgi:hypothetical protein
MTYMYAARKQAQRNIDALKAAIIGDPETAAQVLASVLCLCKNLENRGMAHAISSHAKQIRERISDLRDSTQEQS